MATLKVTAIEKGYYGSKLRVPGEVFGIEAAGDFSAVWMASDEPGLKNRDPLDHDGDGRKGGAKKPAPSAAVKPGLAGA